MKALLFYIYTDQISNDIDIVLDLLLIADQFQLIPLKTRLEQQIVTQLSPENALEM